MSRSRLADALPFVLVAVFLGLLALALRDVLTAAYLNGDAASGPVIAELREERDGRDVDYDVAARLKPAPAVL